MDKAIELLQSTADKLPAQISDEVVQLRQLHDEKFTSINKQLETRFDGIDKQFLERDKRTEQLSLADKTAIAAALQAQKEAAGAQHDSNTTANSKMEANFATLISQTQALLQEVRRGTDDKINDLRGRLDKGEGVNRGVSDNRTESRASTSSVIGIVSAAFVGISMLVSAVIFVSGLHGGNNTALQPAAIAVTPIAPLPRQ